MGGMKDLIKALKELGIAAFCHWECLAVAKGAQPVVLPANKAYDNSCKQLANLKKNAQKIYYDASKKQKPSRAGRDENCMNKLAGTLRSINYIVPREKDIQQSIAKAIGGIEEMVNTLKDADSNSWKR